jgi:hypothetical protein
MKVFKMLHLNIPDVAIVKDIDTFHGLSKGPPSIRQMVSNGLLNIKHDIENKNENISNLEMTTFIA